MVGTSHDLLRVERCAYSSSYKPAIFINSGFLVNIYSEVLEGEDWALAGGGGWVRGKGSNGSGGTVREGLEKADIQRKKDGKESFAGMNHSSMDQQHARPSARWRVRVAVTNQPFLWTAGFRSMPRWKWVEGELSRC